MTRAGILIHRYFFPGVPTRRSISRKCVSGDTDYFNIVFMLHIYDIFRYFSNI